ncbi:transposase family protein [Limibacter armeniacum]|uniref:transposase family protein n=1 Tax=Limibacter armeniacum TaxID=466084 RepID=UPI002FE5F034
MKTKLKNARRLQSLTSLRNGEFDNLLPYFEKAFEEYCCQFTLKGKPRKKPLLTCPEYSNSSLPDSSLKLYFILYVLKTNPLQEDIGEHFQMSQGKVSEWIAILLPCLQQALARLKSLPARDEHTLDNWLSEQIDAILLEDATDRPVPRSTDYVVQEEHYSGKHGKHTVKNLIIINRNREVGFLSQTYEGSVHDKTVFDNEALNFHREGFSMVHDLGFQGVNIENVQVIIPFKKQAGLSMPDYMKEANRIISRARVRVEHVIGCIKRLRMVKEVIRLKRDQIRDQIMLIATGLHNFRNRFRAKLET